MKKLTPKDLKNINGGCLNRGCVFEKAKDIYDRINDLLGL